MISFLKYLALIGTFFIYTSSGVFSKLASQQSVLSIKYLAYISCTIGVLGFYAILWQQIIKRMHISKAYMFKGLTAIFGLLLAHFIFGETISMKNAIGATVTILGITLFARA
jgi:drug/metabolite transporter (DMT)-like permease